MPFFAASVYMKASDPHHSSDSKYISWRVDNLGHVAFQTKSEILCYLVNGFILGRRKKVYSLFCQGSWNTDLSCYWLFLLLCACEQ